MKLLRIVKYDLVEGTIRNWYKFLIVILIAYISTNLFHLRLERLNEPGLICSEGTVMDYIMYSMEGLPVYKFDPYSSFYVPIYWFVFQIWISYIVAYYPENNFRSCGKNIFLASKSRVKWWLSKCLWCVINVVVYFIVYYVAVTVFSYIKGAELSFNFTENIMSICYGDNLKYLYNREALFLVLVLPCVTTIAISIFQILLAFLFTPVISFAMICGLYVISTYYTNELLIGSYTMWLRSSYVNIEGVNPEIGLLISLLLVFGSVLAGCIKFDRKDVF